MKPVLVLVAAFLCAFPSFAQDPALRTRAVSLLERTHAASSSPNLPNLERVDTFVVFDPRALAREGSFTRVVIQGAGRRDEIQFGDYHLLNVYSEGGTRRASTGPLSVTPPEVATVLRLTPIRLLDFDDADIIRAILDKQLGGFALHCIEFDTIEGERREANELCVDEASGALISAKLGDSLAEYSNFFPFAGAVIPGKIVYYERGARVLEITQTMTALSDVNSGVLEAPPGSAIGYRCTTARRAIGQFMPQPEPGRGGRDWEVLLRGRIGYDGKVHDAVVQSSERDDLNDEALQILGRWTFLPPMCNGRPNSSEATFVLHFRDR
jgi:Gram-negative bacterial TonB protein C-terminal